MRTWGAALLAFLVAAPVLAQEPTSDVRQALAQIADASTVELSTVGRKTRRIHTRPVWFVVDGDKVVVQSGKDGRTDWYRNLEKNPQATLRTADWVFTVSGSVVNDPARVDEIHRLFMQKYRTAWLLSLFGSSLGRGRPVELKIEKAAPRQ
jgi:deazaflavin-dependent oxidoreductase (nitroreductase family)